MPNPLFVGFALFSFKKELTYLLLFFPGILMLPVIAVIILTNTGIPAVSHRLAKVNVSTHTVTLYYPNGQKYKDVQLDTAWPMHGIVTLEFGAPDPPYQPLHTGIDIATTEGTPIVSATSGTVSYSGEISWGYGKHVVVDDGDNLQTLYGHLSELDVNKGDKVVAGETVIGKEGQTGWATGPHVHFEFDLWGVPVDPRTFISGNP